MKLHNLSVIFIVIAIPLILITAYYISLQIDTINMQTSYNTKLLDSTKEAIDAFEINTVEWNANYSETADSKRRDVMASINTFINSFANNLGVGGTSKEYIMAYMPAIAYTLYDGYYIYSPANEKVALTDENGVGIVMTKDFYDKNKDSFSGYVYNETDEGKLLYVAGKGKSSIGSYTKNIDGTDRNIPFTLKQEDADEEYDHILKPFALYSERIGNYVINYTLDNYITIYGNVEDEDEFVYKAGYLTNLDKFNDSITANTVEGITFNGSTMEPEYLSEKIAYKNSVGNTIIGVHNYVYESEGNTKVYFDESDNPFIVDSNSNQIDLNDNNMDKYKKVTIPQQKSGTWTYKEVYQNLRTGDWYDKNKTKIENIGYGINTDKKYDYSAINYCVESYIITKFVNELTLTTETTCECGYNCGSNPLQITENNDPEDPDSAFCIHKRGIIKNTVESNLNQAITIYSRNTAGEYKLPKLTETDWDQILENVSIITFIQNIPIGLKYYNNYAIATSTVNKEYVDPDEIYLNASGDTYYHMPYCTNLGTNNLIGYRSIDYVQKSYTVKENGEEETKYYYKHTNNPNNPNNPNNINVEQACYYCLVQRSLYEDNKDKETDTNYIHKATAYNTALARERYIARMSKLPAEVQASYYIHVYPYYLEGTEEKIVRNATYKIIEKNKETGDTTEINQYGNTTTKISKDCNQYTIKSFGIENSENQIFDASEAIEEYGNIGNPKDTEPTFSKFSVYKVKGQGEVKVDIYNYSYSSGLDFVVDPNNFEKWGAGESSDNFYNKPNHFSTENDGYINFKVEYEKTYKDSNSGAGITAFANINDANDLTIATNTGTITGLVRLKFTNTDSAGAIHTYYSKDIFNIENENTTIYCQITNESSCWYKKDWTVEVLDIAGNPIKSTDKMEYYTINTKQGLKGFANATNGGAKTETRIFYLIRDVDLENETVNPICQSTANWFDGYFGSGIYNEEGGYVDKGGQHSISNLKVNVISNNEYAWGLFGWVGAKATIENLIIDNITINNNGVTGKHKVGGLAGFADAGNYISNIIVSNSNITGSAYVGGLVGYSKKAIGNSEINNTSVLSIGTQNVIEISGKKYNTIYVGGVAGLTEESATINICKVSNSSKIGEGSIKINNNISYNKDRYYVGGIVGYTKTYINTPTVESSVTVKGGEITGTVWDDNKETYTGGVIGYKATNQNVDSAFNVNCSVSGHDNVGGIVGYNADGNIDSVAFKGTITGDGENIGGIAGCNTGGNISNCTNNITINATGKNVGGIVGLNYGKNITNCTNNGTVTGNKNVGGIAGITYGGEIDSCANIKTVTGMENSLLDITDIDGKDLLIYYNITGENATGTGGIAGKIRLTTISKSYNNGKIQCNFNGGGITGICAGGTIKYCFNENIVTNQNVGYSGSNNRLGGICGAGNGLNMTGCYNVGEIVGKTGWANSPLASPVGGLVGFLVDDSSYLTTDVYTTKYLEIDLRYLDIGSYHNIISYCYNAGNVKGHYSGAGEGSIRDIWDNIKQWLGSSSKDDINEDVIRSRLWYNGAIVGYVGIGIDIDLSSDPFSTTTFTHNYYLQGSSESGGGRNGRTKSEQYQPLEENAFKEKLYKWASSLKPEGEYIYNTTAPVETDKGYKGYGILWWQLKNYNNVEFYIGSYYAIGNKFGYKEIEDEHSTTLKISGKSVTIDDNNKKTFNEDDINCNFHNWKMMIKPGKYNLEVLATDYGKATKNEYEINATSKNKILGLLHTGAETIRLEKSGNTRYNWDHDFTVSVPCIYRYNFTPLAEWSIIDSEWSKEDYQNKTYTTSTRFGGSKEESSSYLAQVYLDGLDGNLNSRTGKTNYSWEYYKVGNRYKVIDRDWANYWWEKGNNRYGPYTTSDTIELDSKCTISIPMESLIDATSTMDLQYNPEKCRVSKADLIITFRYWINENIISKLDFTGTAAEITEKLRNFSSG